MESHLASFETALIPSLAYVCPVKTLHFIAPSATNKSYLVAYADGELVRVSFPTFGRHIGQKVVI